MRRTVRTSLFAMVATAVLACCTSSRPSEELWNGRPRWVEQLRENVGDVSPLSEVSGVTQPERSDVELGAAGPIVGRGAPRDLTKRLARAPTRSPRSAPRSGARAVSTPPKQPSEEVGPAPSRLERLFAGSLSRGVSRTLKQFGYDQLAQPVGESSAGPVPDSYVVGPGDEVSVATSGSFHVAHRVTVDRDGRIRLPDLGSVAVGGRRFGDLEELLRGSYATVRRDFDLTVGLGRLRRIRVQVIGQVARPGFVEISALGDAITALRAAGGPNTDGSLRRVRVTSGSAATRTVDAYAFLLSGASDANSPLRDGDVVFVPPIGATVAVAGAVRTPGIFEVLEPITLAAAIELAGGRNAFSFAPRVQIERTRDGRQRETIDVELDEAGRSLELGDGELVMVGAVDGRQSAIVKIDGEVLRPGVFQHRQGMRVSDLVQLAEGLSVDAHIRQVFVSRVVGGASPLRHALAGPLGETRRRVIVIDLSKALAGLPSDNIEIEPLDLVTVPAIGEALGRPTVTVIGAVRRPGTYELTASLRVSDLVALAGNFVPEVFYPEAELIRWSYSSAQARLDARRFRFHLGRALENQGSSDDPLLENGDRLIVRAMRKESVEVVIDGQVRFPGKYVFGVGARISDLIAAAGGVLSDADMRLAAFSRESVRELQQRRFRHLAERTRRLHEGALESMVQEGHANEGIAAKLALENTKEVLGRMSSLEVSGRVVLPFVREDFVASVFDLELENGDRLVIPRHQSTVSVMGQVFNPGSFVAEHGLTVADVLDWSGGLTEFGDERRLYVIRGTGRVQSLVQSADPLRLKTQLLPGDVVLIPRRPLERTLGAQLADLVHFSRDVAEVGLLAQHIAAGGQLDVTAVLQSVLHDSFQGYDRSLLRRDR